MQAKAYLDDLARQVASHWLNLEGMTAEDNNDAEFIIVYNTAMEVRMRQLLREHGATPSMVTAGHQFPAIGPTTMDVLTVASKHYMLRHQTGPISASTILWEPTADACAAAGCRRLPASRLLLPHQDVVSAELLERVRCWFPEDLRVRPSDSRESLIERIASSSFLDDMDMLSYVKSRKGAARRLNETDARQPRRATFSVVGSPVQETTFSERADAAYLFHYYGFQHARAMPALLFDLGTAIWQACYQVLSDVSRLCPFTHCQLLIYYECFGCCIRQHRDNSNTRLFTSLVQQLETDETALLTWDERVSRTGQRARTSVVIFTLGTSPMQMCLRFPHADHLFEHRSQYAVHPTFTIRLSAGTVFVWDALDDVFFTHEACFPSCESGATPTVGGSGWREAYVFRHVDVLSLFHSSPELKFGLCMTPEREAVIAERIRMKRRRRAKARADLFNKAA